MADTVTPEERSRVMSRVRSRNTRPELYVRRTIWLDGFRYRLHVKKLPGVPDLVLPKYRTAVFVHGCFWHQHDGCPRAKRPDSNQDYWNSKLDGNMARDTLRRTQLEALGWTVVTIWECNIKNDTENFLDQLRRIREANALRNS